MQKELEETERTIKQYKQKQAMFRAQGQTRQLIEAQRAQQAQMKIRESLLRVKNEGETENDKLEKEMKLTNAAIKKSVWIKIIVHSVMCNCLGGGKDNQSWKERQLLKMKIE